MNLREMLLLGALALPIGDNCEIKDVNVSLVYSGKNKGMQFDYLSTDSTRRIDLTSVYQLCDGVKSPKILAIFDRKARKYCISPKLDGKYELRKGSDPRGINPEDIPKCP